MKSTVRQREWFADESFWRELYLFMFPEERIAVADEQIEKVLALTKPTGNFVLDLCCGPGRCSFALAKREYSVTGVDRTKYLLDKARAKGVTERVKFDWVRRDMRDFVRADALVSEQRSEEGKALDKGFYALRALRNCLAFKAA